MLVRGAFQQPKGERLKAPADLGSARQRALPDVAQHSTPAQHRRVERSSQAPAVLEPGLPPAAFLTASPTLALQCLRGLHKLAGTGARAVLAEQRPNTPHRTFHKTLVQRRDLLPLGLCVEAHTAQGPQERSETQQLQNSTAQWSLPATTRDVCPAPPAPGRMCVRMYRSFCADKTAGRVAHSRALRYNSQRLHRSLGDPPELNASSLHNLTTPRCLIHISRDMCCSARPPASPEHRQWVHV